MRGINVKVDGKMFSVDQDPHGYRIRFFTREHGYIGSYFPHSKRVGYLDTATGRQFEATVRGKVTGVKALVRFAEVS